jgi:hypothetical protein
MHELKKVKVKKAFWNFQKIVITKTFAPLCTVKKTRATPNARPPAPPLNAASTMADCVTPGGVRRIRESADTPIRDVSVQVTRTLRRLFVFVVV